MASLTTILGRAARLLRRRRAGWSVQGDQAFHDAIFSRQDYDPFDPAYPGWITIRRFADLAAARVEGCRLVADLGCGPGEITCELGRRFPAVRFLGWDHSEAAIARARQHASTLGLSNVAFEAIDVSAARVDPAVDLVTMFDAFHHLLEPRTFLAANAHVPRWFLIEPAGDALGRWRYTHDFDWLLLELDKVRWRLAQSLGEPAPSSSQPAPAPGAAHEDAVEFRYGLDEYEAMFAGYGLDVAGTCAGLNVYPPGPAVSSTLKRRFGEFAAALFADVDARLRERGEDLDARHWALYLARGETFPRRRPARAEPPPRGTPIQGPYGVAYTLVRSPEHMAPGETAHVVVLARNLGFLPWASHGDAPVHASYHWRHERGSLAVADGRRTPLAAPVPPGGEATTNLVVEAPPSAGRYVLEIDLVHEGVTWFSEAGQPTLEVPITVGPAR